MCFDLQSFVPQSETDGKGADAQSVIAALLVEAAEPRSLPATPSAPKRASRWSWRVVKG